MVKKTGYSIEQELALELYLQNHTLIEIGKRVGKTRHTIVNWVEKFKWDERKEKFRENLIKKTLESNEEAKDRLIKFYKNIVDKGYEQMINEGYKISIKEMILAGRAEAKLRGLEITKIEPIEERQAQPMIMQIVRPDGTEIDEPFKKRELEE